MFWKNRDGELEGFREKVIAKKISLGDDRELARERREKRTFWAEGTVCEKPVLENQNKERRESPSTCKRHSGLL